MPNPLTKSRTDRVVRGPDMDKKIKDYIINTSNSSIDWWRTQMEGTMIDRVGQMKEWRLRMEARRSVAQLQQDVKTEPFLRSTNVGIGLEQIFEQFLTPTYLANTVDLEPMLQAVDEGTEEVNQDLTTFHDNYHRHVLKSRNLHEISMREMLTVGTAFHKWTWGSFWRQDDVEFWGFIDPETKQPVMIPDGSGGMALMPADPKMPKSLIPRNPNGVPYRVEKVPAVETQLVREGPQLSIRRAEDIEFPPSTRMNDPNDWDYVYDNFAESPFWFLGREGDPFEGKLQNLDKLWKWLKIDPNKIYEKPDKRLIEPVALKECHLKFPVTSSGTPVKIIALLAVQPKILLGWRTSVLSRVPYFNHQVWSRGEYPLGKGIPETMYGLRNVADAMVCQEVDTRNLWRSPPLLLSQLAMIDDEDYEQVGPGTQWILSDINGAKFLPPPVSQNNPIEFLNWIISMGQRIWGVSDLNLNAPTQAISPNVKTATGVVSIMNQGNVKFGNQTKKISEVHSAEFMLVNEMFRKMMANPRLVSVNGQPLTVHPQDREKFFSAMARIEAVGNGITTNPMIRQQAHAQVYQLMTATQNPFVVGDMDVLHQLTKMLLDDYGIKINVKDPQALQDMQMVQQAMSNPIGKQLIARAIAQMHMLMATQQGQGGGQNGNVQGQVPQGNGNAPVPVGPMAGAPGNP